MTPKAKIPSYTWPVSECVLFLRLAEPGAGFLLTLSLWAECPREKKA